MPSPRWIPWTAGLTLALSGCATPAQDMQRLLWPDQFHLTYETADGDLDSRSGAGRGLESERDALLFGLSWDLSARAPGVSKEDLRWLVLELRRDLEPSVSVEEEAVGTAEASALVSEPESSPTLEVALAEPISEPEPEPLPEPAPAPVETQPEPVEPPPAPAQPLEVALAASEPISAPPDPAAQSLQAFESTGPAPIEGARGRVATWIVPLTALGLVSLAVALRRLPRLRPARAGK